MSKKEEHGELQKQIGCISGFFQLFDRHRFLTNQRSTQNMPNQGGTSNHIKELNNTTQKTTAKNVKFARENQQFSTESSGTSVSSSSRSSSMSSMEFNRTIHIEPPTICQMKMPETTTSGAAMKQLVKDSMQRDIQGLSVNTVAKEEKKSRILKYIDSPRPLQASQSVNTGVRVAWDSPRLSYDDGRNIPDTCKSAMKNKELPRLSLDSRRPQKGYGSSSTILKQMQEPETLKRPSSVVAKLMGLESFPDTTQTCDTPPGISSCTSSMSDEYKRHQSSDSPKTSRGSRRDAYVMQCTRLSQEQTTWRQLDANQGSQLQTSKRSESSNKASNPSLTVYGEIEKRMANLEFKSSGKDLRALKQILEAMQRYKESLDVTRDQALNSTSENKHDSNLSESSNKVQSPRMSTSNSSQGSKSPIFNMKPINVARKTSNPASTEMSIHGKSGHGKFHSGNPTNGILVDKLDRKTAKCISPAIRHVKDPIHSVDKSNKMRTSKSTQSSKVPRVITGENTTNSSISTDSRSPRLQKKFGLERRSPPSSPSSDSSTNRRQHNKQSAELSSPSTTPRKKFPTLQERNDHFREISHQQRDFKHEFDVIPTDFGRSMDSHSDIEDNHIDHSEKINSNSFQLKGRNQNNDAAEELSKESFRADKIVTTEQPSPVSVLDAAFYREDPPSPVKKKSDISKDLDESLNSYDSSDENTEDFPLSSNNTKVSFSNGTSGFDLKTQNLVQVLQKIDYNDERFTNFSDNKDADHKYISEILLASGLLSIPSSNKAFHSSGYLINPKLFLALEQIKTNKMCFDIDHSAKNVARMNNPEKMQRKLIFDVINDILVQKLTSESSSTLWCQPRGKQLFDEICAEIDKLQHKDGNFSLANVDEKVTSLLWEDLSRRPTIYTDCHSEIPSIVLDIERLIFKDLITDIVRGEVENQSGKHCRQLMFPK